MTDYIITFYTHYSAMLTKKAFDKINISSRLCPVPRELSSSCGTCLIYSSSDPHIELVDEDYECIYKIDDDKYIKIKET